MKWILLLVVLLALSGCISPKVPGMQRPTPRNWATFEVPPVGTPLMLRVFNVTGPRQLEAVDLQGQWDDGDPFLVSFVVTKRLECVIRVEIHYRGDVLGARNFKPPTIFEKDQTVGWRK